MYENVHHTNILSWLSNANGAGPPLAKTGRNHMSVAPVLVRRAILLRHTPFTQVNEPAITIFPFD